MKQRIMKAILATLLITTLTMANFILLGINVVTYAVDNLTEEKTTNHKNVEFMAYLKNEKGEKLSNEEVKMNATDLKMYLKIAVKQEGYFNGQVTIKSSNFKIEESNNQNQDINKIEGNTIYFNQIRAGEEKEFEIDISLIKDDAYDISMLEKETEISINGIYKDSTQKDITIKATRKITLKLVEPYSKNENTPVLLDQKVITNKIYETEGTNKRIVQMQVEAGLQDNAYPEKSTKLETTAPQVNNTYPKTVEVTTPKTLMTNGQKIQNTQYTYDQKTGKLTITIENPETEGKINWAKTGTDAYIITYKFEEEETLQEQQITTNVEYNLYDENQTQYSKKIENTITSEEKDETIELQTESTETEIYKGKLYAGIEREYTQNIHIQVNAYGIADSISVSENYNELELTVHTKQIQINKENMKTILGEEGKITILEKATNTIIAEIDKNAETDKKGNITINIPENIKEITIQTTKPEKPGILDILTNKTITGNSINQITAATEMKYSIEGNYTIGTTQNTINKAESTISLKETQTTARLEINKEELTTMTTNKNVEMKVILQTSNESQELYKAPTIQITLPDKIEEIKINSIKLLYENELQIKTATLNGKTLQIELENEQTQYKDQAIEGAVILISADLTTNKKERNSTEKIQLTYTNQKAIHYQEGANYGQSTKEIKIVSYAGVVTTSAIEDYGIETINNEGTKQGKLQLGTETKTTTVKSEIFNNQENQIENVKILGTFPTQGATTENNIKASASEIRVSGIDATKIKKYYTENQEADTNLDQATNGWTEQITDNSKVKKYLITVDNLNNAEDLYFEYDNTIPENLEYNQTAKQGYDIYYTQAATGVEQSVQLDDIKLETGVGPVVETTLKATVGGENATKAKKGEIINYTITAKNTGTETATDIKLVGQIPENTVYIEEVPQSEEMIAEEKEEVYFAENPDKKQVEFNINKLEPGQEITKTYQVKIKETTAKTIENKIQVQYGEAKKESNTIKTNLEEGNMEIYIYSVDDKGTIDAGYTYRYIILLTNNSNKTIKNTKVTLETENITVEKMYYNTEDLEEVKSENGKDIKITEIAAGQTIKIGVYTKANQFEDTNIKQAILKAKAISDYEIYRSNQKTITTIPTQIELTYTSENAGEYVKAGDEITYKVKLTNKGQKAIKEAKIEDILSKYETLRSVTLEGNTLSEENEEYTMQNNIEGAGEIIETTTELQPQESKEYVITSVVNKIQGNTEAIEFTNKATAYSYSVKASTAEVKHILEPEETTNNGGTNGSTENNGENNNGNNNEGNNGNNNGNTENTQTSNTKIISGTAWLDKNENGQKDSTDTLLEGIIVKILDTNTNTILTNANGETIQTKTNSTGFYSLAGIPQGKYIVIFEYDTTKYGLVEYQKQGVSEESNSNAINKTVAINGANATVGSTDIITIQDKNIANINIGLKELKIYDMKLDKYVSRIVVNNQQGVSTYEYGEETLAKAEIHAKQINQTNVVVEYKIKVTNEGEIPGYIKKIEDKISTDYKFSSELNKDWYQSGNTVINTSLANTKIEPGESKEITLILTKQMTENNTGLINNTAEITESYNEQGMQDKDSTPGNNDIKEDDMGSADVILSIKTGEIVITVVIIITSIIILSVGAYIIARIVLKKRVL